MANTNPIMKGMEIKNWIIVEKLGNGACSEVYLVQDKKDKNTIIDYAMKISPLPATKKPTKIKRKKTLEERNADSLYAEHLIYQNLNGGTHHPGIPTLPLNAYGEDKGYRFLVIERLGRNLGEIHKEYSPISEEIAARLGLEMIDILKFLHSRKIIFVDIKPENFMLNYGKEKKIYCVDFGISERYILAKGNHKEYKTANCIGTPKFLSLSCHEGSTPSRKDDIEGMLYVLLYLLKGHLPWENAKSDAEGAKIKKETTLDDLCSPMSIQWKILLEKIRKCKFDEEPDYRFFIETFKQMTSFNKNDIYDWTYKRSVDNSKAKDTKKKIEPKSIRPLANKEITIDTKKQKQNTSKVTSRRQKKEKVPKISETNDFDIPSEIYPQKTKYTLSKHASTQTGKNESDNDTNHSEPTSGVRKSRRIIQKSSKITYMEDKLNDSDDYDIEFIKVVDGLDIKFKEKKVPKKKDKN